MSKKEEHKSRIRTYILMVVLCALPFVFHFGYMWGYWVDRNDYQWAVFLPLWISVFIADVLITELKDPRPAKKDALFLVLSVVTLISYLGSVGMLAKFYVNLIDVEYDAGCYFFSVLMAAVAHLIPVLCLVDVYRFKKGEIKDIGIPSFEYPDGGGGGAYESGGQGRTVDFNPTRDYYGKHGEFDKNDDCWGNSEYIRQFRNNDPDVDLSEHFDWQELAEAESDGFLEDP